MRCTEKSHNFLCRRPIIVLIIGDTRDCLAERMSLNGPALIYNLHILERLATPYTIHNGQSDRYHENAKEKMTCTSCNTCICAKVVGTSLEFNMWCTSGPVRIGQNITLTIVTVVIKSGRNCGFFTLYLLHST